MSVLLTTDPDGANQLKVAPFCPLAVRLAAVAFIHNCSGCAVGTGTVFRVTGTLAVTLVQPLTVCETV